MTMTVINIAASMSRSFDFISTSRRDNDVEPDFEHHLFRFMRFEGDQQVPRNASITFICFKYHVERIFVKDA